MKRCSLCSSERCLSLKHALKPGAVCKIRMVIGGDHGQGAFRLCFRVVINLKNKKKPIHKIKAVAEVYSSKEEGIVLERSIMLWLKEDMEKIAQSALKISIDENPNTVQDNAQATQATNENQEDSVIYDDRGCIVCDYSEKTSRLQDSEGTGEDDLANTNIISNIEIFITGDMSFYSYILGKDGASSQYCPYCPLTKEEWTPIGHEKAEGWTVQSLTAMANDSTKSGTQKKGVKCCHKLPCVPVLNITPSLTHWGLGVDNDAINLFADRVEWTIIAIPPSEEAKRARWRELVAIILAARQAVNNYNASTEGKNLTTLEAKNKLTQGVMSNLETDQLKQMSKRRNDLVDERKATRKRSPNNDAAIKASADAVKAFDASKAGKLRSKLVKKNNGSQRAMSLEELARMKILLQQRTTLEKARDSAVKQRTDLKKELDEKIRLRRKDADGWHIPMDRIYLKHGCKREDYFKRQFSGRPLKQIKKNAGKIFRDAKALLMQHKSPSVAEAVIDKLCNDMVILLTRSYKLFALLHKECPDDEDVIHCEALVKLYMSQYREMFKGVTPKAHCIEDHSVDLFIRHMENGLPLMIEQFVERNHQDGRRLDEQCKRIVCPIKRARTHARRKALDGLASINRRIKEVNDATKRGIYKLKEGSELIDLFDDDDDEILFVIPSTEASSPTRARSTGSVLHFTTETETQAVITPTNPPVESLSSTRTSTQEDLIMEDGMEEE